jgi:hypothetical protein
MLGGILLMHILGLWLVGFRVSCCGQQVSITGGDDRPIEAHEHIGARS